MSAGSSLASSGRLRWGRRYLDVAVVLAAAPLALVVLSMVTSIFGRSAASGFDTFAMSAGAYLALASVATGLAGLIVALVCGFSRLWSRAFIALMLSVVTVGGFVMVRFDQLTRPPVDETVADLGRPS